MVTRSILLGTTAIAALGLAACNNSNDPGIASAAEIGVFGYVVGEPVALISATRGQGASVDFDQFQVTFNNAEGTDITITTQEGEEIDFNLADPATWVGEDPELGGHGDPLQLARLVSEDGDRLEVMIGSVEVPVAPEPDTENGIAGRQSAEYNTEEQLAFATARLDENDTRDGFETYAVVGDLTDIEDLPRYTSDVFEDVEGEQVLVHAAGDLIEGTAFYYGDFLATVYKDGLVVSDAVTGDVQVEIDFEDAEVYFEAWGSYLFDDVDDKRDGVITGVTPVYGTVGGEQYVAGLTPTYSPLGTADVVVGLTPTFAEAIIDVQPVFGNVGGEQVVVGLTPIRGPATDRIAVTSIDPIGVEILPNVFVVVGITVNSGVVVNDNEFLTNVTPQFETIGTTQVVTGLTPTTAPFLTDVQPVYGAPGGDAFLTDVDPIFATIAETQVVVGINTNTQYDNSDKYDVDLEGFGNGDDINFDSGVTYTGDLDGTVQVPIYHGVDQVDVAGEFGGAVFGPGDSAFDVLDTGEGEFEATPSDIVGATATAGVFEANSGENDGLDPSVEIVGVFGAEDTEGFCEPCSVD